MTTIISKTIGGVNINLPVDLPATKTRKAVEKGIAAKSASDKAWGARDRALELKAKAETTLALEDAAIYDTDPDAELSSRDLVSDAKTLAEDTQRELNARTEAERRAGIKIRESILEELPDLTRASLADGDTALAILAAVIEDAEAAQDALKSSLGVARMCVRLGEDEGAPLSVQAKAYGYTFSIAGAIEGLYDALARAGAELAELRAATKPAKGKKARTPRKAASEAPVAAPTPPVAAALGDLTIGGDDDD